MANAAISIERFFGDLILDKDLYSAPFQKPQTITAQIKQKVTTKSRYPTRRISSDLSDNLFKTEDYGFDNPTYESSEVRVCWLSVPKDSTREQIQNMLKEAQANGAVIYRILDCKPVLDSNQKLALSRKMGDTSMERFANTQVCRYPETHSTQADELITYKMGGNEYPMYRRTFFSAVSKEDLDWRDDTIAKGEVFYSDEIRADLGGAANGNADQTMEGELEPIAEQANQLLHSL